MQTAWIAFAGVVVGAVIGFLGPVLTTRLTVRTQMSTAALNTFLNARLDAYRDYETAMEHWSLEKSRESIAALYHAMNVVALVASDETIHAIAAVQEIVREHEVNGTPPDAKDLSIKEVILSISMHQDLLTYPVPTAAEAKKTRILRFWNSRLTSCRDKGNDQGGR